MYIRSSDTRLSCSWTTVYTCFVQIFTCICIHIFKSTHLFTISPPKPSNDLTACKEINWSILQKPPPYLQYHPYHESFPQSNRAFVLAAITIFPTVIFILRQSSRLEFDQRQTNCHFRIEMIKVRELFDYPTSDICRKRQTCLTFIHDDCWDDPQNWLLKFNKIHWGKWRYQRYGGHIMLMV